MDDTSLADFVQGENAPDEASPGESERDDRSTTKPTERPTSEWLRDGSECENCGETVARRWRDDGQMVCNDCKDWE